MTSVRRQPALRRSLLLLGLPSVHAAPVTVLQDLSKFSVVIDAPGHTLLSSTQTKMYTVDGAVDEKRTSTFQAKLRALADPALSVGKDGSFPEAARALVHTIYPEEDYYVLVQAGGGDGSGFMERSEGYHGRSGNGASSWHLDAYGKEVLVTHFIAKDQAVRDEDVRKLLQENPSTDETKKLRALLQRGMFPALAHVAGLGAAGADAQAFRGDDMHVFNLWLVLEGNRGLYIADQDAFPEEFDSDYDVLEPDQEKVTFYSQTGPNQEFLSDVQVVAFNSVRNYHHGTGAERRGRSREIRVAAVKRSVFDAAFRALMMQELPTRFEYLSQAFLEAFPNARVFRSLDELGFLWASAAEHPRTGFFPFSPDEKKRTALTWEDYLNTHLPDLRDYLRELLDLEQRGINDLAHTDTQKAKLLWEVMHHRFRVSRAEKGP